MISYKWIALSNTTIGSLMASIDGSIVLISLPTILQQLPGTGLGEGLWIIMSYMLVTATLILNFGRLGDMFGRVRMYNIGFVIFTVGSLLCSLSQNGFQLIIFRIVQALGAAFLWSNSAAIITDAFPINERGKALGINQVAIVIGSVAGLVIGGILTDTLGWRSIFWVNVPIGIFATVWAYFKLKEMADIKRGQKLDMWGNISFAAGLTLFLLGITMGSLYSWNASTVSITGVGILMLSCFIFIESKVKEPMFHLSLFRIKVFAAGNIAMLFIALARGAFNFMMVFYLQGVLGYSAFVAGVLLIPTSLAVVLFGPLSGWLSDKYGAKFFASVGLLATALAFLILATLPSDATYHALLIPLFLMGAGIGLFSSPNRSATLSSVPPFRRGVASGTSSTIMNVGMLLSLGISILLIGTNVPHYIIADVFGGSGASSITGGSITTENISNFMVGLHDVFYFSAVLSIIGIIPVVLGHERINSTVDTTNAGNF